MVNNRSLALALTTLLFAGCQAQPNGNGRPGGAPDGEESGGDLDPDEPTGDPDSGRDIYATRCAGCHGPEGDGGIVAKPLIRGTTCTVCGEDQFGALHAKIEESMPTPGGCVGDCAINVATYIYETFTGDGPPEIPCADQPTSPGESPLRRLNRREYVNTVVDLLGIDPSLTSDIVPEAATGFDTDVAVLAVSTANVDGYARSAERIAAAVVAEFSSGPDPDPNPTPDPPPQGDQCDSTVECQATYGAQATDCADSRSENSICMCGSMPCDPGGEPPEPPPPVPPPGGGLIDCAALDRACAETFVDTFGPRFFRRPLAADERAFLQQIYTDSEPELGQEMAFQLVLEAMLQSPAFLYRPEFGDVSAAEGGVVPLTSWELATRLSYMFWATTPDEELMELAAADELRTAAQVRAQAERLLADPRARPVVSEFFRTWLGLGLLGSLDRDPSLYPGFSAETPDLFRREAEAFIDYVMWEAGANWEDLLTAPYSFLNDELADFYGLPAPGTTNFVRQENPGRSHGFLSLGGFMSSLARDGETAPILRGVFVLEKLMCVRINPPENEDDVDVMFPEADPSLTTRERWEALTGQPGCASCHRILNPSGFVFENYDAVGRWRDRENGLPIDTQVDLVGTDIDGTYSDVGALAAAISTSDRAMQCAASTWAAYSFGREIVQHDDDQCSIEQATDAFADSDTDLRQLLIELTQTDAFLFRNEVTP